MSNIPNYKHFVLWCVEIFRIVCEEDANKWPQPTQHLQFRWRLHGFRSRSVEGWTFLAISENLLEITRVTALVVNSENQLNGDNCSEYAHKCIEYVLNHGRIRCSMIARDLHTYVHRCWNNVHA